MIASAGKISAEDNDLKKHLRSCHECAAFAAAEMTLCRDLATAGVDDNSGDVPLSALKTRVEARALPRQTNKTKEIPLMSAAIKYIRKRPRLGATFGVALAVMAFITLIPFSFENTVGYEVAIAGVDKDLAMDTWKIQSLMTTLGLKGAKVDVSDCETTCLVVISELENEGDVNIVITAFDEMGNCLLEKVDEVRDVESMSLLKRAQKLFVREGEHVSMDYAHQVVVNALGYLDSTTGEPFHIWVTDEADTLLVRKHSGMSGDDRDIITIEGVPGVDSQLYYVTEDSHTGDRELIAAGDHHCSTEEGLLRESNDDMSLEEKPDADLLPENFELKQNYPNPFNPDTRIDFTIPEAQNVKLEVFNSNGQKVRTLIDGYLTAGEHTVEWNATDESGEKVASGIYLYRLTWGDFSTSKKMTLLK